MFKLFLCFIVALSLVQVVFSIRMKTTGTTTTTSMRHRELLSSDEKKSNNDEKIEALLNSLSLEAKIGQMVQLDISLFMRGDTTVPTVDYEKLQQYIAKYEIGSLLNSPFSGGPVNGITGWTAKEWRELMIKMQIYATTLTTGKIPIIYGIDSIHGATFIKNAALMPQAINVAATFNPSLAYSAGEITSKDTRAGGIPWIFAPVLGLGLQPAWARFPETFGEDPYLAAKMGASIIQGLQVLKNDLSFPKQTAACMKHFIAYSIPYNGHDRSPVQLPDRILKQLYMPSFQAAIDAGVMTGMESYQEVGGVPMVSSKDYLTTLLRKQMKFNNGFLVTDYAEIENLHNWHLVSSTMREAVKLAMQDTTIDMSMVPLDNSFYDNLLDLVTKGEIPVSRVDDSVRRILQVKQRLGLLSETLQDEVILSDNDPIMSTVGQDSDWEVSLNAARESITLTKNEDNLLPLPAKSKVLVTGPTCNSAISQTGGWALHWQGGYQEEEFTRRSTVLSALQQGQTTTGSEAKKIFDGEVIYYESGPSLDANDLSAVDMTKLSAIASTVDYIVVCVGEGTYAEKPGDIDDLALPQGQIDYVKALSQIKPVVLVMIEGRPRLMHDAIVASKAVLLAYQPGPIGGQAIAEVIAGQYSPSGRMPFSYPRHQTDTMYPYHRKNSDQCTVPTGFHSTAYVPCEMEFVFGEGLSFTNFEYSNLLVKAYRPINNDNNEKEVSSASQQSLVINENDIIKVSVTVKNTGDKYVAKHSVLLFVYDLYRRVTPEYKLLKRFTKVELAPGESKTIVFEDLTAKDLEFVGVDSKYILESGDFRLGVGAQTDCRSDNIQQDWYLTAQDTTSSSPMCAEFSLQLTSNYQPVCDSVCAMWSEGVCGQQVASNVCRETCIAQKWTWDYANCVMNYYGEQSCGNVNDMQCFDAFGTASATFQKQQQQVKEIDHSDDSSAMILTVALVTSFLGLVLGFAATYIYFVRNYLPSNKTQGRVNSNKDDDFASESLLNNRERYTDSETL